MYCRKQGVPNHRPENATDTPALTIASSESPTSEREDLTPTVLVKVKGRRPQEAKRRRIT